MANCLLPEEGDKVLCSPLPSGGYDCDFVESSLESLECPVCLLVLKEPHLLSCCGVKICYSCISGIQAINGPCPKCRKGSFITLLEKELQRSILNLKVKCSLGCPWVGELRHLERHIDPSSEGDCPLVTVSCRHGCGHVMKREQEKDHEEEVCPKRPIELQLARLQYHMENKLKEIRDEHEKDVSEMKALIAKQNEEIAELKQSLTAANSRTETFSKTLSSLNRDILHFMPKLPVGSIPGVKYYPTRGMVEIYGSCDEEVAARCWLFRVEYQKLLLSFRARNVGLSDNLHQQKLEDFVMEINLKYHSSYVFVLKNDGRQDVMRIFSILPSQVDEIARLLQAKFASMTKNYLQLSENRRLTLKSGDITREEVDVIVSATNRKLSVDWRGVASALNKASNGELKRLVEEYLSSHGPIETGDIAITSSGGGSLKCKHIFHLAGPSSSISDTTVTSILQKGITKVLSEAERIGAKSVAIPAIGAGSILLKNELVALSLLRTIKGFEFSTDTGVTDIRIVVYASSVYPAFLKAFSGSDI